MNKPRLSVHKFTSCDGCQLAFLNAGEALLILSELVEIVQFAEAGLVASVHEKVDIAVVEGSISMPGEIERIKQIRDNSQYLITIGACATAGGIQALRQAVDSQDWMASIYASPEYIQTLKTSTPISAHVRVDCELWGCPVNTEQVMGAIRALLFHSTPRINREAVCMQCKRRGYVCVMVTKKQVCMGPVTQTGCGALCPSVGRGCYACYGPKENSNTQSLGKSFLQQGLTHDQVAQQFLHINNQAPAFHQAGQSFKGIKIVKE